MENRIRYPGWVNRLRKIYYCLFLMRFNFIILGFGWLLLLTAQGQDALISYIGRDSLRHIVVAGFFFFLWIFYWAFSIWFFARTLFRMRFPTTPTRTSDEIENDETSCVFREIPLDDTVYLNLKKFLPRVLGTVAFLAVAQSLWKAKAVVETDLQGRFLWWIGFSLALIIPFFLLVQYRRNIAGMLGERISKRNLPIANTRFGKSLVKTEVDDDPYYNHLTELLQSPWGWFAVAALGIGVMAFFLSTFFPVPVGAFMGAVPLFFLWAGSWLPIGSWITYIGNRFGIPMIALLLLLALISSGSNDNHDIRTLEKLPERVSLDQALNDWKDAQNDDNTALVLVATAGGGIRAAYWTATVLGELQEKVEGFDKRLFAISGVSGGSVGASVYRALLNENLPGAQIKRKSREVLSEDFLGPAVAGLLFPDLFQRFLPFPIMPDRGRAMEAAWERAYRKVVGKDTFQHSLLSLYDNPKRQWPALLLNATRVETGRRSIASNLDLKSGKNPEIFAVTDDQLQDIGYDLPLSAAAHNSARFPGVSPAGHWKNANGDISGRLVDGGYFENFGAESVLDILRTIDRQKDTWKNVTPIVIAISSDPAIEKSFSKAPAGKIGTFANEILSPVSALLNARTSHGIEALQRLKEEANKIHADTFYHLRMCAPKEGNDDTGMVKPPLGWSLSDVSRKTIEGYLDNGCNGEELHDLIVKLKALSKRMK